MPALASAKLGGGSGGVSIDVGFVGYAERAGKLVVEVNNKLKEIKASPNIDYVETAVLRGLMAAAKKWQQQAVRLEVDARLKDNGLALQQQVAAAIARPLSPTGIAPNFTGMAQGFRPGSFVGRAPPEMVATVRTPQGFSPGNFDSMVGLTSPARFSDARVGRFSGMPDVSLTPEGKARASIKAAHLEYDERMRLEKQFADELESETPKKAKSKAGGAGLSGLAGALRGGAYGFIINEVAQAAFGVAGAAKGLGVAAISGDRNNQRAGLIGAVNGAESIPVIGTVISGFDKLAGFTESLNNAMALRVQNEQAMVTRAQLRGDPLQMAQAGVDLRNIQLNRQAEKFSHPFTNPIPIIVGNMTGEIDEVLENRRVSNDISNLEIRNAKRTRQASLGGFVTSEWVATLQRNLEPQRAERAALGGQWANAILAAPDFLKDVMSRAKNSEMSTLSFQQGRQNSLAQYARDTSVGASGFAVKNYGLHLEDEAAFKVIRDVQRDIKFANKETIFDEDGNPINQREQMAIQGLSRLRELKASLQVRGGGVVGATNLQTDNGADPFNIMPQTLARLRAGEETNNAMKRIGVDFPGIDRAVFDKDSDFKKMVGPMSRDESGTRAMGLDAQNGINGGSDVTSLLVAVLQKLSDSLGKGGLLLPN